MAVKRIAIRFFIIATVIGSFFPSEKKYDFNKDLTKIWKSHSSEEGK